MKLAWLTDIHLDFLNKEDRIVFYHKIIETVADKILITGDIAEAPSVGEILKEIARVVNKPLYFVLGNHDYYHGQVDSLRKEMLTLTQSEPLLYWLPASGVQHLGNNILLLGQDCWADGRYGNYAHSHPSSLRDSTMIHDLWQSNFLGKHVLLETMQQLADKDAEQLKTSLTDAIRDYNPNKIIILMHVPPFREACLHEGKISNDDFLPFFSSKITGQILTPIVQKNPKIEFLVLCGHTHSEAYWQPCDNLVVKAGKAEYTKPEIQEVFVL